ncbi:hypothetical protein JCGZ_15839 [Jatropha curcas]|uniref:BHLH domain-containing protein n=1 Tax=Jatropha curcas TaxID=180498 RepID=A0A067KZ33_JATCU|nr:transcription factor bHLH96 [Jatropha curcas]KDP41432.1 hypothetical protein JCGZ_15839 [Jatropha curcas]
MALEAVVYPQDPFGYVYKDCYSTGGAWVGYPNGFDDFQENQDIAFLGILDNGNNIGQQSLQANWDSSSSPSMIHRHAKEWDPNSSSPETCAVDQPFPPTSAGVLHHPSLETPAATTGRRKRRRTKSTKNKEEIENQRMTHIAVERNRRKQMNEYLAVLRSLMPPSYVQRGDQASIIGGAINFVKELEQLLQTMEAHKKSKQQQTAAADVNALSSPFAEFFTFPQYSTRASPATAEESVADQNQWAAAVADIEVTMVESHANLKILSKKRPRQLLKMVAGLQGLRLSVLHLNVTAVDQLVLYSVSVKVEEGCHLNTVDEIAAAVNQMLHTFHEEESAFS